MGIRSALEGVNEPARRARQAEYLMRIVFPHPYTSSNRCWDNL